MQEELTGQRSLVYSAWHRRYSTQRFVGIEAAQRLAMIDIDACLWVEYDDRSREPLAVIETAMDVGQTFKASTVTRNLAKRAGISAYCCLYRLADEFNPAASGIADIASFRVRRLWPTPSYVWRAYTPEQWARLLLEIRECGARVLDEELAQRLPPRYMLGTQ